MFQQAVARPVLDLSAYNDDIENLLALSGLLDWYVGVSNTMTHLRAAAGGSSDVLVPLPTEFRWMNRGDSYPWFPKNTIYRQQSDGSWKTSSDSLARKLNA